MIRGLFIYLFLITFYPGVAQVKWDDVESKHWPPGFKKVNITSSLDSYAQPAIVFESSDSKPQPLIVSLHTWSGDYLQTDSLAFDIYRRNWNYIHPDFRGPNNKPIACGSNAAIQDVDDAIQWAIQSLKVDPNEVHIVGVSGGGYLAMMCYMQLKYPAKSFSSWVGISDLEAWYYESLGRGQKYAGDVLKCAGDSIKLNREEAKRRSPLHLPVPKRSANLHLYAGIHDGYKGSVPITHTLNFYNKIVAAQKKPEKNAMVTQNEIMDLVVKQTSESPFAYDLGKRGVHLFRKSGPVSLTVFEGGHEMIVSVAANLLPVYTKEVNKPIHVLAIGDSNGDLPGGWVHRLQEKVPWIEVFNAAKAGRTIGFDNNSDTSLNELRMLQGHLKSGLEELKAPPDWLIIALGTNDAKAIFDDRKNLVPENFKLLLNHIGRFRKEKGLDFKTLVVLPPPVSDSADREGKYAGANEKLNAWRSQFREIAIANDCVVLDAGTLFYGQRNSCTYDGVHLTPESQVKLTDAIISIIW
ncbi:MAG: GDSL-type esterase/lipase family protein [Chitinophagaceae bacterium]|nr:GDSL-type esterase/lipase family protein [Chitinophagaceae bacterium]